MRAALIAVLLAALAAGAWLVFFYASETLPPDRGTRDKPLVMTTFYPTTWLAERLAGSLADVRCPLPADEDPIFWQPDDATLSAYQQADLIVVNGAEFEKWVATASLPASRVVDTAQGFAARFVLFEGGPKHSHGSGPAHSHQGVDGHTWLDPLNAIEQAQAIAAGLKRSLLQPGQREQVDAALAALQQDLAQLDAQLRALGTLAQGRWLYASHPAYNYLVARYGWPVVNLDLDPEEMPADAVFADVKRRLAEKPGTHLLWESAPKAEIAARFERETALRSLVVEPCETMGAQDRAAGRDYLARWKQNLGALREAFAAR